MTRSALIWALLLCIVLVNGAMAAPSVGHAEHHADHQAGAHSTGLCAWLCVAGQGVESSSVVVTSTLQLVEGVVVSRCEAILDPGAFPHFLRGPPVVLS